MPLHIENETHWRTPDIQRLVKAAVVAARADPSRTRRVNVVYHTKKVAKRKGRKTVPVSELGYDCEIKQRVTKITIKMPKNGPKDLHHNPMVAIAVAASLPADGTVLAPQETFWFANSLAYELCNEPGACEKDVEVSLYGMPGAGGEPKTVLRPTFDREHNDDLEKTRGSLDPPAWADASKLLVFKVKDPLKDGTYLDFVKRKTTALKKAETAIEKETATIEAAKRRLKKARDRKKEIERSLKSAKERRS